MFLLNDSRGGSLLRQPGTPAPPVQKRPENPGPFPDYLLPGSIAIERVGSSGFSAGIESFQVQARLPRVGGVIFEVAAVADERGGVVDWPGAWPDREKWTHAILKELLKFKQIGPIRELVDRQTIAAATNEETKAASKKMPPTGLAAMGEAKTARDAVEILEFEARLLAISPRNSAGLGEHVAAAKAAMEAIAARQATCVDHRRTAVVAGQMAKAAERDAEIANLERWAEFFQVKGGELEAARLAALGREQAAVAEASAALTDAPSQYDADWRTIWEVSAGSGTLPELVAAANRIKARDAKVMTIRKRFGMLGLDFARTFPDLDLAPRFVTSRSPGAHVGDFLAELRIPGLAPRGTVEPPPFIYTAPAP